MLFGPFQFILVARFGSGVWPIRLPRTGQGLNCVTQQLKARVMLFRICWSAFTNMDRADRRLLFWALYHCCFTLCLQVRSHPVNHDPVMSDLSPYNSLHGPEQIHIAYGDSPKQMTVMWSTSSVQELASSFVLYGLAPENYSTIAKGELVLFTEGNPRGLQYVHRVLLEVRNKIMFTVR